MLEVRGVNVHAGGAPKLRDIELHVHEGETVAVLGPNGAGKTTLMRAIVGLLPVQAGEVRFLGEPVGTQPHALARRGLVLAPQNHPIFESLTVDEHLELTGNAGRRDRVLELFPELEEHRPRRASGLSGGQRQMLSMAQSLMLSPRLLLLDEPSSGLAPKVVQRVFEAVRAVVEDGTSVLIVEQQANACLKVADRAIVLEHGGVAITGTAAEVAVDPHVRNAYLGISGTSLRTAASR